MYTVRYDGHVAEITPKLPDIIADALSNKLCYEPKGAEFSPNHKSRRWKMVNGKRVFNNRATWDGKIRLFKKGQRNNSFPSGLLVEALTTLGPLKLNVNVMMQQLTAPADQTLNGKQVKLKGKDIVIELRDYQKEVVDALINAPFGRAMAESPTGSGKSIIIAELCTKFPAMHTLITVPSKSLMYQTAADLEAVLGEPVGRVGDSIFELHRVTVAIIDSLRESANSPKASTWLDSIQLWVIDESHMSAAESYQNVSSCLPNTERRFGVSATVHREDGAEMVFHGLIGPLAIRIDPMRLIESGHLAKPNIEMHIIEHDRDASTRTKPKYDTVYKDQVVNNTDRNDLIFAQAERCLREKRTPCLILVKDIKHGEILQEMISHLGPTAYLHGEDSQTTRENVLTQFQGGTVPFLVASTIFDVGVDIPEIQSVILAGAGKSAARAIQRVGRGLRKTARKSDVLVVDFEDREPNFLLLHSNERMWWYREYYPGCVTRVRNGMPLKDLGLGF
jgi:superfamily II DNA or RNA helicase